MSVFDNLPSDSSLPEIGIKDPNNSAQSNLPGESPMVGSGGQTLIRPTDHGMAANSPYGYMVNGDKVMPNGGAPGNGSGSITDNNGQGNSSGIPAAQPIDPLTFGDPNDTGLDFRDGMNPNSVDIAGGGSNDIKRYGFDKPALP